MMAEDDFGDDTAEEKDEDKPVDEEW